ncbi:MAG: heme o synthase [Bacteroidota bacterium]
MIIKETKKSLATNGLRDKVKGYQELLKFRLSFLVAISAVFGLAIAAEGAASGLQLFMIGLGGLLITGASNGLNQVFEKDLDAKMKRTQDRPLPTQRLTDNEAIIFSILIGAIGILLIGAFFNLPAALLGIIGLLSYAFVYTPMKRVSPIAVFIGAIPGGLPPLIGWVAWTGEIGMGGWILFVFQFFWQFPHFWAIAWLLDEDYKKAGFKMLPSASGKSKFSATLILMYTITMVPLVFFAWSSGLAGTWGLTALVVLGIIFCIPAFRLYRSLDDKHAKALMFASFLYLPLSQLAFLFG